jgi:hypothetical protein
MEAVGAMAQVLEKDVFEPPVINPWRRRYRPSQEQVRFATDLCRTELAYAERIATVNTFAALDGQDMSELIERLKGVRAARLARLRRPRRTRR